MSIIVSNREMVKSRFLALVEKLAKSPANDYRIGDLANETGISKFHFHRLFSVFFGINIYEYIILLRIRTAAKRLKYSKESITNIAFESGYSSSQSFSKSFKATMGQSPSEFRKCPDIKKFYDISRKLLIVERKTMNNNSRKLEIIDCGGVEIASLRHKGSPTGLYLSIEKFIAWRHSQHLFPKNFATFNVFHNPLSGDEYDIELGCEYAPGTQISADIAFSQIPKCKCASLTYIGSPDDINIPATELYNWVIESGYEVADYPLFCRRVSFPPFVEEDKSETIIYLPIR